MTHSFDILNMRMILDRQQYETESIPELDPVQGVRAHVQENAEQT